MSTLTDSSDDIYKIAQVVSSNYFHGKPNAVVKPLPRLEIVKDSSNSETRVNPIELKSKNQLKIIHENSPIHFITRELEIRLKSLQDDKQKSMKYVISNELFSFLNFVIFFPHEKRIIHNRCIFHRHHNCK